MKANEFDKNAKSQLFRHESPMDVDAFWDQLEPKLPKDKSRPKIFILFFVAGLLLCSGLFGWYIFSKSQQVDSSVKNPEQSIAKLNSVKVEKDILISKKIPSNSNETRKSKSRQANSKIDNKLNSSIPINGPTRTVKTVHAVDNKKHLWKENQSDHKSKNQVHLNINNAENLNGGSKVSESLSKDINNDVMVLTEKVHAENGKLASEHITKDLNESVLNSVEAMAESKKSQQVISNWSKSENRLNELWTLVSLPVMLHTLEIKNPLVLFGSSILPVTEFISPEIISTNQKIGFQLLPIIGIGFYNKKLTDSGNSTLANYLKLRNELESNLEEWLFGVDFKISYKKFALMTGIEYVNKNERFDFFSTKEENHFGNTQIRIENRDSIIYNQGVGWYGSSQIRKVVHYNHLRQWNVPLGLNYSFALPSMRFELGAGALFSMINQIAGQTLDTKLNVTDWGSSPDLSYRTNLGVGWYGELNCIIPISNGLSINSGFRFQEFPANYLTGSLNLNYRSYMFRSGIVIKLFKN